MGTIIDFPAALARRAEPGVELSPFAEPATVIILPVIRIERYGDAPTSDGGPAEGASAGRRRRRRS